ncbi:DedA family protein [Anoxybacillus salavatliensis]|uniref:YqaA family protein n=1 Tax=Anoxybacillus gonensis TaxID=198467 RepID=UPI00214AA157|nr:YqaA family protein [Anoxybacillus gonensis]MCQ5363465.1 DedA family protein [Anoxybacillus gonensis]
MSQWIHHLEQWLLEFGVIGLVIVSFTESSFFPIPPDVLLIPLSIAQPEKALWFSFLTTVASVFGALLGWYIGKKFGRPILRYFISDEKMNKVEQYFQQYGAMAIVIAGFTPIPYKVFTIFSGISNVNIRTLLFWSFIGRGARFFAEGLIIFTLGAQAKTFIEQHFTTITIVGGIVMIIAFVIYKRFK